MQEKNKILVCGQKNILLPNTSVGKYYEVFFERENIDKMQIYGLIEIGLTFDQNELSIKGTPTKSGEFKLTIKYSDNNKPLLEKDLILTINPDPKSLWKNIPSNKLDKYWKEDTQSCHIINSDRQLIAASQRGRSHAHQGTFRDDHFKIELHNDFFLIAVADGAGSAKFARKGAEIMCNETIAKMKNYLDDTKTEELIKIATDFYNTNDPDKQKIISYFLFIIFQNAISHSLKLLQNEAINENAVLKDYATTLLLIIYKKIADFYFFATYSVGDGAIAILLNDNEIKILNDQDTGEFAGQTRFITMREMTEDKNIYQRIKFECIKNFVSLFAMTDGITDPKFETENNLLKPEKWNNLWNELIPILKQPDTKPETELLEWLNFWSKGNHDDRTLAIIY